MVPLEQIERIIPRYSEEQIEQLATQVNCIYDPPHLKKQLRYVMRRVRVSLKQKVRRTQ